VSRGRKSLTITMFYVPARPMHAKMSAVYTDEDIANMTRLPPLASSHDAEDKDEANEIEDGVEDLAINSEDDEDDEDNEDDEAAPTTASKPAPTSASKPATILAKGSIIKRAPRAAP